MRSTSPKPAASGSNGGAADLTSPMDRAGYLTRLRRLAEECRQSSAVARPEDGSASSQSVLAAEVAALRETAASLAVSLDEMKASRATFEARLAVLERSVPSAQVWRDLIHSIRSIRDVVAEMQRADIGR